MNDKIRIVIMLGLFLITPVISIIGMAIEQHNEKNN